MKTYRFKITAIVFALLFVANFAKAQDIRFSQPFTAPLHLNPATTGLYDDARFLLNGRSQYANMYQTASFNGFYPVYYDAKTGNKLDVGVSVIMDKAGAFQNLNPLLSVGYRLQLAENHYLTAGISGGIFQKTLNTDGLTFDDQYILGQFDETNPSNEIISPESLIYPDINFGLMWNTNFQKEDGNTINAFAGFSVFHANEPNESLTGELGVLPRRFSYQAGMIFSGDSKIDIAPNIISNYQNGNNDLAVGVYLYYNLNETQRIIFGTWYRDKDAIACIFKIDFFDFELGYAYDIPNSDIGRTLNGMHTHEISLIYKLKVNNLSTSQY